MVALERVVLEIIAVKTQLIFVQTALITMHIVAVEGLKLWQLFEDCRTIITKIADWVRAQIHPLQLLELGQVVQTVRLSDAVVAEVELLQLPAVCCDCVQVLSCQTVIHQC